MWPIEQLYIEQGLRVLFEGGPYTRKYGDWHAKPDVSTTDKSCYGITLAGR